jgi:carbonic anhydrase
MEPLSPRPRRKLAVLTCMDCRIDPLALLGLEVGDAHVVRNAGGLATDDAIRSLAASQRLLGTEEVLVLMHTGCGMHGASDDEFRRTLAADGAMPSWRLGAFDDLEAALLASLERLRAAPELAAHDRVRGAIVDIGTLAVREVDG